MADISRDDVLRALAAVADPHSGSDVVAAGRVVGLTIKDRTALFALEVPPAVAAEYGPVRDAAEAAALKVPGIDKAVVVLTAHDETPGGQKPPSSSGRIRTHAAGPGSAARPGPPAGPGGAGPGGGGRGRPPGPIDLPDIQAVIAVASGKGGVGKSTTAVNLALALQALGQRVGLLDADVYGPSMPRMLNAHDEKPAALPETKKLVPLVRYGLKVMSMGFLVDEATPTIWRGPMVMGALEQMLREVEWGALDVLVIDMPPGTGDAQLTLAQRAPLAGAVIVSTPQAVALGDVKKGIAMFERTHVPILGVIENMSTFVCSNCGTAHDIFGSGGALEMAAELGADGLGRIPLDVRIRETSDAGTPILVEAPAGAQAQAYLDIASQVAAKLAAGAAGGRKAPPKIEVLD